MLFHPADITVPTTGSAHAAAEGGPQPGRSEDIWDGPPLEELAKGVTEEMVAASSPTPPEGGKKIPALRDLLPKIPESNRKNLRELLGGEFRGVLAWQSSALDLRK